MAGSHPIADLFGWEPLDPNRIVWTVGPEDLNKVCKENKLYRHVFGTHFGNDYGDGAAQQVAMAIGPGSADPTSTELGREVHHTVAQYFAVVEGSGVVELERGSQKIAFRVSLAGESKWEVPPGWYHNVRIDRGSTLKLLTIYHPPHHPSNTSDSTAVFANTRILREPKCEVCNEVALIKSKFFKSNKVFCCHAHLQRYVIAAIGTVREDVVYKETYQ